MTFWNGVLWLHLLAMAFFVGGQLMLAAVVVPVLRGGQDAALRAAARRFGVGTLVAVGVLVLTGAAMASPLPPLERLDASGQARARVVLVGC